VSVSLLRERVRLQERGMSLRQLLEAAASLGLRGQAVRVGPEQLGRVTLPAIAHLLSDHYVVLYELRPESVVVGDPAMGVVTLSIPRFWQAWSGNLLL